METLCRLHVKEGSVFQLICPDSKCKDSIPPYVLKRLLTEAEYERWDRLLLQKTLDSMSNVVYCPNCVIGCMEDEDNNAQCPKCSFVFCSFCKGPCHPGKKCLTPEEQIQLRKVYSYIGSLICSVQFILRSRMSQHAMILLTMYRFQAG
jgi:E3 ubiquitin-protein ligase RNF14